MPTKRIALYLCSVALACTGLRCEKATSIVLGYEVPKWRATVQLSDGRVLVTDTFIALDVSWAKPDELPDGTFPAEGIEYAIERVQRAGSINKFHPSELKDVGVNGAIRGPEGVLLNPNYVKYLQWHFMTHTVELAARSGNDDVVILIDGDYAGAIAPMKVER